jgi:hypothetical protein
MGVNAVDRDHFRCRVFKHRCHRLQSFAHILVGDVATLTLVIIVSREECFCVRPIVTEVDVATCGCADRAIPGFTVCLVIHADTFPSILLVVQLQSGSVSRRDEMRRSIPREASELATVVLPEESDVFVLELDRLLGTVPRSFDGVFAHPE